MIQKIGMAINNLDRHPPPILKRTHKREENGDVYRRKLELTFDA